MGLPSPSIQHLKGQFIGTEIDINRVDEFGNQVAAQRYLSGGGHIQFHNIIQYAFHCIFRRCQFHSTMEAANLFQGIVPPPFITRYTHHYAQIRAGKFDREDAIIPDIMIDDYPAKGSVQQYRDGHNKIMKSRDFVSLTTITLSMVQQLKNVLIKYQKNMLKRLKIVMINLHMKLGLILLTLKVPLKWH